MPLYPIVYRPPFPMPRQLWVTLTRPIFCRPAAVRLLLTMSVVTMRFWFLMLGTVRARVSPPDVVKPSGDQWPSGTRPLVHQRHHVQAEAGADAGERVEPHQTRQSLNLHLEREVRGQSVPLPPPEERGQRSGQSLHLHLEREVRGQSVPSTSTWRERSEVRSVPPPPPAERGQRSVSPSTSTWRERSEVRSVPPPPPAERGQRSGQSLHLHL